MKRHRFEAQDGFAGLTHRFNLLLEPSRGGRGLGAEPTVSVYIDRRNGSAFVHPADVADKATVAHVRAIHADANNVVGVGNAAASSEAQADVVVAAGVITERFTTERR